MTATPRDRLVETALTLFNQYGFHATGIDRIIAESGVAKMTLYKHFRSKEELILAVLRHRDESFRQWLKAAVERRAESPRQRLLAVFEVLGQWHSENDFHGCPFTKAAFEFDEHSNPIHRSAAEHIERIGGYIQSLAEQAGARDPRQLAAQLLLLYTAAATSMQFFKSVELAHQARRAAESLVREACDNA